jgi:exonuclease III
MPKSALSNFSNCSNVLRRQTIKLSNSKWILKGYSLNVNSLNGVSKSTLLEFSTKFHLIALQETKFTSAQKLKRVDHLWRQTSVFNTSFWSQSNCTTSTGQAGVGILLTPTCPIKNIQGVTQKIASNQALFHRYLLLQGSLGDERIFIHVVYAPVDPTARPQFFQKLPTDFPYESSHLVLGGFNTVFSVSLDQAQTSNRARQQGREELLTWMADLGLVDAWRAHNPMVREFTGPHRSSRIDFVFMSESLCTNQLNMISYDFSSCFNNADHAGIEFHLGIQHFRPHKRAPWRYPEWVIDLPESQEYLRESLMRLADKLRPVTSGENYNPGCLLDEHKRCDAIFLRETFKVKK